MESELKFQSDKKTQTVHVIQSGYHSRLNNKMLKQYRSQTLSVGNFSKLHYPN